MQYDKPREATPFERQQNDLPDEAMDKLGSAQRDSDPFDGGGGTAAGMPTEIVAAERRPADFRPVEGIPAETQANDFMTPEGRPSDVRP